MTRLAPGSALRFTILALGLSTTTLLAGCGGDDHVTRTTTTERSMSTSAPAPMAPADSSTTVTTTTREVR